MSRDGAGMSGPGTSESTRHWIDALHERDKAIVGLACASGAVLSVWFGWLLVAVVAGGFATRRYIRAYRAERRSEKARDAAALAIKPDEPVPHSARYAMQQAIWNDCIRPGENEWSTWTDAIILAESAAEGLVSNGYRVIPKPGGDR